VKQSKTRKDFYLEEDYDAYRAEFAFEQFLEDFQKSNIEQEALVSRLRKFAEKIQETSYRAGYANAEFDAAENEE